MKIFQIERNSNCPCESGRKFKKCCQTRVEDAVRCISQVVGAGFTAEGLEVIETLGFLCGLQAEGGHMPAPEFLGAMLSKAWEEEERVRDIRDEGALQGLSLAFQVLLEKAQLRHIRIPLWQFDSGDDAEIYEVDDEVVKILNGPEGRFFIVEAADSIGRSLLYDDYTEDELKTLLIALGWLVIDDTRSIFLYSVLHKTRSELVAAGEEADQILESHGDEDQYEVYEEMHLLFRKYPVYEQMLSDGISKDINPAIRAVAQGELPINVPLYAVFEGTYAVISKLTDSMPTASSQEAGEKLPPLEETLFAGGEYHYFFPEITRALDEAVLENQDNELRSSLNSLLTFLVYLKDTRQINILKFLYLRCICIHLSEFPRTIPDADLEFSSLRDYCNQELIERYADYLESQDMNEEAAHVRDVFISLGEQARGQADLHEQEIVNLARAVLSDMQES